jgi:hypothetical protein
MILEIKSHGPLIVSSNFWDLPAALVGKVFLSLNGGASGPVRQHECAGGAGPY